MTLYYIYFDLFYTLKVIYAESPIAFFPLDIRFNYREQKNALLAAFGIKE